MNFHAHTPRFSLKTLVALIALCAVAFWAYGQLLPKWNQYQQLQAAVRHASEKSFVPLENVIVNLASKNQMRYLRVGIALQVSRSEALMVAQRVKNNEFELRDWLITHLSGKTIDDVRGTDGIDKIRNEVKEQFETILFPEGNSVLEKIVFDEFMVQ